MPRLENPAQEKVPGERSQLFCRAIPDDLNMPLVPDAPTLDDRYEKAQALVTRIVAAGAAIVLAFLACAALRNW